MALGFSEPIDGASNDARLHVAREIHDEIAQPLIAVLVQIRELQQRGAGAADLKALEESVRQVLRQAREMMIDLRERGNLRLGLVEALKKEVPVPQGHQLAVRASTRWPAQLNGWAAFNLLRIVQQAVANAWRHGRARSVRVVLDTSPADDAVVVVQDDGVGIEEDGPYGFGMTGMRERAIILGGSFSAKPVRAGGTRVEVRIPVARLR